MKYFIFLAFSIMLLNCKSNKGTGVDGATAAVVKSVEEQYILSNQKNMSDSLVQVHRNAAMPILEHRLKTTTVKSVTGLDKDIWHFEAILKGSDITFGENLKGAWIDFGDDATYKYGSFGDTFGGGKYHYDVDKGSLIMIDNDKRIKAQEFQPLLTNDALVFVGISTYGDNNTQAKLLRNTALPIKPEPKPVY
ncbi:MAG: hypothetical protein IPN86_11240 [Saprospiraceae bacterium]|jgi:hypothetical protein|nr:hypothetical protein [Saprospiraceae bacterium]